MLTDTVLWSGLESRGYHVGGNGWVNTDYFGRQKVMGVTIKQEKKVVIKTKEKEKGKITLDKSQLIILGGPFEKIGEKDEVVGEANQKVGSANK